MSTKRKAKKLSEEEIDDLVVAHADDEAAWGRPVQVRKTKRASISLSAGLAARAAFFARLHREADIETWVGRIIQERIDLEEAAFTDLKRDLVRKGKDSQQEA